MKMHSTELEELLADGFAEKFARFYLNFINAENRSTLYDPSYVKWAHERGFQAEYAYAYGLTEENYEDYLSDYDFYKVWPLNNWARIWINDKLTLKYMLAGTEFEPLLPKYYFYSMANGLRPLVDCDVRSANPMDDFVAVLKRERIFACKPNNDTMSKGFVRLSYHEGRFFINDEPVEEAEIRKFVESHQNYVFQEYIRSGGVYGKITPLIHTLRILVINEDGISPRIVRSYFRFPCKWSGEANYIALDGINPDVYTIYADVDVRDGSWGGAKLIYANRVKEVAEHPDSHQPLSGRIADWDRLQELILGLSRHLNTCEYMGFDIGITDKGFRLMEINSHPEIRGFQCFRSMLSDPYVADYFKRKLAAVDALTAEQKRVRNAIPR